MCTCGTSAQFYIIALRSNIISKTSFIQLLRKNEQIHVILLPKCQSTTSGSSICLSLLRRSTTGVANARPAGCMRPATPFKGKNQSSFSQNIVWIYVIIFWLDALSQPSHLNKPCFSWLVILWTMQILSKMLKIHLYFSFSYF